MEMVMGEAAEAKLPGGHTRGLAGMEAESNAAKGFMP